MNLNFLSRIVTRTPSLRARVVVATAIGAAIPVLITCAVVWFGITNDRKERLDRRLDEAAGFAIPFLPRGLGQIPKSPNDQDAIITVRRAGGGQRERRWREGYRRVGLPQRLRLRIGRRCRRRRLLHRRRTRRATHHRPRSTHSNETRRLGAT